MWFIDSPGDTPPDHLPHDGKPAKSRFIRNENIGLVGDRSVVQRRIKQLEEAHIEFCVGPSCCEFSEADSEVVW